MRYIKLILSLFGFCAFTNVWAQLSTNEKPVSFGREAELRVSRRSANPSVTMPQLDMVKINKEDSENDKVKAPARFGYTHIVNYNLNNSGTWYELSNGDKIWQLNITCPEAKSINLCYDKFWLPEGGKFFVYSKDRKYCLGPFTSRNNKGNTEKLRGFATGLLYDSEIVLEYYQPKEVTTDAIISLNYVVHGYRFIRDVEPCLGFGQSGSCMVDVNCDAGKNWQSEKNAVTCIVYVGNSGAVFFSGALINTSKFDEKPLLLTGYHCLGDTGYSYSQDNPVLDNIYFYWNYELIDCNDTTEPSHYYTTGATVLAYYNISDFALFLLDDNPRDTLGLTPCYLGWDRSGQAGGSGVCIHHPQGDVKKISTVGNTPPSSVYFWGSGEGHWEVTWGDGVTEVGSSGSPLLNSNHKVIGQLHRGDSECDNTSGHDLFGKISRSWVGDNLDNYKGRLDYWLDTMFVSTIDTLESLLVIPTTKIMDKNGQLWGIIRVKNSGQLTIQGNLEHRGNGILTVESGGKLIIDGGKLINANLDLKPGATLRIINNGTIETRNGFTAPVGAKVEISHGKIL